MQGIVEFLKGMQLHPVVDHFTVALVLVAILIDLFASLLSTRLWLRNMAVTLMVLGAIAAIGSKFTGGWEAERVWDSLSGPAKDALKTHAEVGNYLAPVLSVLALWRVALQFFGFVARTRFIYLIVAVIAGGAMIYQGDLGGDLVYEYGIGTAPMEHPTPSSTPSGSVETPTPLPTVYVPPPVLAAPTTIPSPAPDMTPSAAASPEPSPPIAVPPVLIPSPVSASPAPSAEPSPPASKSTTL